MRSEAGSGGMVRHVAVGKDIEVGDTRPYFTTEGLVGSWIPVGGKVG